MADIIRKNSNVNRNKTVTEQGLNRNNMEKSCKNCKYYIRDYVACNHSIFNGSHMAIHARNNCPANHLGYKTK